MAGSADTTVFSNILIFFHSLLRWGIVVSVAIAGFAALAGLLRKGPVTNRQRAFALWALVLCHVQLLLGLVLYFIRFSAFNKMAADKARYWRFEHIGMMVAAIALVTIGRSLSKKARTERGKHLRVAGFYLLALVIMLVMVPWPFTDMGSGREWI